MKVLYRQNWWLNCNLLCFQDIPNFDVVKMLKVDISPSIEKIVSCMTNDRIFILYFIYLIIIKFVPRAIILCIGCIVTGQELPIVIWNCE